jgi:uncharacterized protein involved in exopolysaccharide biosynthesis
MSEFQIETEPKANPSLPPMDESNRQWWRTMAVLYRWKWFIMFITLLTAGISAHIAFNILQPYFLSTTKVMMPLSTGGSGLAQALAGRGASGAVSALLGGANGDYTRYLSILNSRSLRETVMRKFNLVKHYNFHTANPRQDWQDALDMLDGNLDIRIDEKEEHLQVNVYDIDPQFAADVANFMTAELNRRNAELLSDNARNNRTYVEKRYLAAKNALDSLQNVRQQFQEKYGVVELDKQVQAYYEELAKYRMQVAQTEIQTKVIEEQYGAQNDMTINAKSLTEKSKAQLESLIQGKDRLMPVSLDNMPAASREFAEIYQNTLVQAKLLESMTPLYEQSLFDEKRQTIAVQILDNAVPAIKKAGPKRAIIIAVSALSGLILAMLFALLYDWLRRSQSYFSTRLTQEINAMKQERM